MHVCVLSHDSGDGAREGVWVCTCMSVCCHMTVEMVPGKVHGCVHAYLPHLHS